MIFCTAYSMGIIFLRKWKAQIVNTIYVVKTTKVLEEF